MGQVNEGVSIACTYRVHLIRCIDRVHGYVVPAPPPLSFDGPSPSVFDDFCFCSIMSSVWCKRV